MKNKMSNKTTKALILAAILIPLALVILIPFALMSSSSSKLLEIFIVLLLIYLFVVLVVVFGIYIKNYILAVKSGKRRPLNLCFKILCCLGCLVDFVIYGFITGWSFSSNQAIGIIAALIIPGILTQCFYFLPYLVANEKKHLQETAIFILNLFAGWTVFAWIIALVWAFTNRETKKSTVITERVTSEDRLEKAYHLYQRGIITQEEFEQKKKDLLGL